jgi:hypothetical protein
MLPVFHSTKKEAYCTVCKNKTINGSSEKIQIVLYVSILIRLNITHDYRKMVAF